jgi:hypothetical protein
VNYKVTNFKASNFKPKRKAGASSKGKFKQSNFKPKRKAGEVLEGKRKRGRTKKMLEGKRKKGRAKKMLDDSCGQPSDVCENASLASCGQPPDNRVAGMPWHRLAPNDNFAVTEAYDSEDNLDIIASDDSSN